MIITALDNLAKPAIRFHSKDVIRWADYDCPCGRIFRLIDVRVKTNLGSQIEVQPYGTLPRYEVKARRFKDMRKKGA
jgi:hypothetical protein